MSLKVLSVLYLIIQPLMYIAELIDKDYWKRLKKWHKVVFPL